MKILLGPVKEFSETTRNKINIQKSVAFLYTNNELSEKKIMKTIPFTIVKKQQCQKK